MTATETTTFNDLCFEERKNHAKKFLSSNPLESDAALRGERSCDFCQRFLGSKWPGVRFYSSGEWDMCGGCHRLWTMILADDEAITKICETLVRAEQAEAQTGPLVTTERCVLCEKTGPVAKVKIAKHFLRARRAAHLMRLAAG